MSISEDRVEKASSSKGKLRPGTRRGMVVGQGKTIQQHSPAPTPGIRMQKPGKPRHLSRKQFNTSMLHLNEARSTV